MFRRAARLLVAFVACLAAGCVSESRDGEVTVLKYQTWIPVVVVLAGLSAVPAGVQLLRQGSRAGIALLIVGPLAALLIGPGMFADRVIVTPDRFILRTGFWFAATRHEVQYENVVGMARTVSGVGRRRSEYLECSLRDGSVRRVPVGTLMREGGLDRILQQARAWDIPYQDTTGGR